MQKKSNIVFEKRKPVILILMLGLMLFYVMRLFSMQIVDTYIYTRQADEVSRREAIIPAQRGEIFDRNFDQPLVTNIDSFVITIDLSKIPRDGLHPLITRLAEVLGIEERYLWGNISTIDGQDLRIHEVWNGANYRQIAFIAEQVDQFPGVAWESRPARYYPQASSLAHVLGYVGKISSEELQLLYNQGYASAREIGKTGIEKQYDHILRGSDGVSYGRFDAKGKQIRKLEDIPPKLGNSIVLTIDRHIQLLVEKALGNRTGGVVVLDPRDGEILAMASYPSYDPNVFSSDSGSLQIADIHSNPQSPLLNRTIQSVGSPASTFKTLMSVAMLQEEAFDPLDTIHCSGSIWVGNREFHCHLASGHGSVNMYEAVAESCNVYFYTIGKEYLGVEGIHDYALQFGLGEFSGVDLPGEKPGFLPTPEWKERTYNDPWNTGDTVNLSIGQGFLLLTPLQLSNITAGIFNDGIIYQPHLIKEVRDQTSLQLISEHEPRILKDTGIDSAVFEKVRRAMRRTITNGTPRSVLTNNAHYVAGKTGTAERGGEKDPHSWFTSYFSTSDDTQQYVVTVWVDGFNEWEWWAPKAANIIIHGIANNFTFEETVSDLRPTSYYVYNLGNEVSQ